MRPRLPRQIVSGGQTGVDRAALDAAIVLSLPHGGWCPQGRRAEDGRIPDHYQLRETDSADYPDRTERNVLDSNATLILYRGQLTGGTLLTHRLAVRHGRPVHCHDLAASTDPGAVAEWMEEGAFQVVNVAGPRESSCPGIREQAFQFLLRWWSGKEGEAC